MRIEYATVPVKRKTMSLKSSVKRFEDKIGTGLFAHWEYESTLQGRTHNEEWFWPEWF